MFKIKKVRAFCAILSLVVLLSNTAFAAGYTVTSGDSLYKIGQLFNTTVQTIKERNNLSGNEIRPGQVLDVPASTYTVKSGDTLYLIAQRYGLSLYSLRKANNKWNNIIYPGQKLILPVRLASSVQTSSAPKTTPAYSQSDLDLLARLITAEADGQPYNAMVSVGAVVMNRVKDSRFPNTVSGVIYQKDSGYYQFTPVENGWINKAATQESRRAAVDALNGVDPTHGAVYYFDDSATNTWLWSKPIAARIGRMVFTY